MSDMNPDQALDALMQGNSRFVDGTQQHNDHADARTRGAVGQSPFAGIIRCADSRVSPELVFDQSLGDLFVCGVAGNLPTTEIIASLEYTVAMLGTPLLVVMGHSGCGAVGATLDHEDDVSALPGHLAELASQILPAVQDARGSEDRLSASIESNVRRGVQRLLEASDIIADAVRRNGCRVVGGVYDLGSGRFSLLDD